MFVQAFERHVHGTKIECAWSSLIATDFVSAYGIHKLKTVYTKMSFKEPREFWKYKNMRNMKNITWNNGLVADSNYSTHCFQLWSYEAYGLGLNMKNWTVLWSNCITGQMGECAASRWCGNRKSHQWNLFSSLKICTQRACLNVWCCLHSRKMLAKLFGLFVSHVDGDVDIRLGAGGIGAYLPLVATDMVHNISLFGLPINGLRTCNMLGQAAKLWLISVPLQINGCCRQPTPIKMIGQRPNMDVPEVGGCRESNRFKFKQASENKWPQADN